MIVIVEGEMLKGGNQYTKVLMNQKEFNKLVSALKNMDRMVIIIKDPIGDLYCIPMLKVMVYIMEV